jgi:hypothetical protein
MPKQEQQVEYVEFVYRCYPDGRRERFARHVVRDEDGHRRVGGRRPEGQEGRQVAELLQAGMSEQKQRPRRVMVDERAARMRADRRRGR